MPGKVEKLDVDLSATGQSKALRMSEAGAGLGLSVGIADWLAIQGGAELAMRALMGNLGVRLSYGAKQSEGHGFALDIGIGGGVGKGGVRCNNTVNHYYDEEYTPTMGPAGLGDDNTSPCPEDKLWDVAEWHERLAWGGYVDIGLGGYVSRHFGMFVRPMVQYSRSDNVSNTTWVAFYMGPNFFWGRSNLVSFHFSLGPGIYVNEWDSRWHLVGEMGVSLRFGGR